MTRSRSVGKGKSWRRSEATRLTRKRRRHASMPSAAHQTSAFDFCIREQVAGRSGTGYFRLPVSLEICIWCDLSATCRAVTNRTRQKAHNYPNVLSARKRIAHRYRCGATRSVVNSLVIQRWKSESCKKWSARPSRYTMRRFNASKIQKLYYGPRVGSVLHALGFTSEDGSGDINSPPKKT